MSEIELTCVSVALGGRDVVREIDATVEKGDWVGLIGPNGAGKTTILDVVTGFTTASGGSVRFGDAVIDRWSVERRARASSPYGATSARQRRLASM